MNKRTFLRTLGLFSILPGAGRVWKAVRAEPQWETRHIRVWGFTRGPGGQLQPVSRLMTTAAPTEAHIRELYFGAIDRFRNETTHPV